MNPVRDKKLKIFAGLQASRISNGMKKGFIPLEKKIGIRAPRRSNSLTGFTLIEMMVSVAIFAVVMTIALGALLAMSESDRKAQTIKSITNNLSFALDSMSRSIRTGNVYHCGDTGSLTTALDCSDEPDTYFVYYNADNVQVKYCLGSGTLCSSSGTAILVSVGSNAPFAPITSPEVKISALSFYVTGADIDIQPKVTILISGFVTVSGTQTSSFNLQTSVTQRLYDQ